MPNQTTTVDQEQHVAETEEQLKIPEVLPVLPLRDIVIFPFMIVPLFVQREKSIRAVDQALAENRMIMLVSQRDLDKEEPLSADLYEVGTVAVIMRMLKLPDGRIRILVQGLSRARVTHVEEGLPFLQARSIQSLFSIWINPIFPALPARPIKHISIFFT